MLPPGCDRVQQPTNSMEDSGMSRNRNISTALMFGVLVGFGMPGSATAHGTSRCTTQPAPPAPLLQAIPNTVRKLLPPPLYGVPNLFISEPEFTKNGSKLYTSLAVWKGSDEELVARATERTTGQRGTFVIQRGAALRGLQYVPTTLPVHGCWNILLKTKSAEIVIQMKV